VQARRVASIAAASSTTSSPKPVDARCKWIGKHIDAYQDRGLDRPWWAASALRLELYPGLQVLCQRELEILELSSFSVPDPSPEPLIVNVTQAIDRAHSLRGIAPCITPTCKHIISFCARALEGIEHLHLQGI